VNAMRDVGAVGKNNRNPQQNYSFRGVDDVMAACHPVFVRHKIVMLPKVVDKQVERFYNKNGTQMTVVMLQVEFDFVGPAGDTLTCCTIGEGMDASDKAANKAMSAALKYALVQSLCIPTEELLDESETEHPQVEKEPIIDDDEVSALRDRISGLSDDSKTGLKAWFHENKVPAIDKLPERLYEPVLERLTFFEGLDLLATDKSKETADE
jgi:hypothetical protein